MLISYKADDSKTTCKLFLCKSPVGNFLISEINDITINDLEQKNVSLSSFLFLVDELQTSDNTSGVEDEDRSILYSCAKLIQTRHGTGRLTYV